MASFAGLISGVLGGAAAGYGEGAQMEMKKQADLDLKKQMLEAETEKNLRLDDMLRQRTNAARLAEEARVQNPEYLKAQADAEANKYDALIKAGVSEAKARALVAEGKAAAGAETALAPVKAAAASATTLATAEANAAVAPAVAKAFTDQYKASKEFENLKASDATDAQIKKAKTLAADTGYMDALAKINLATHANIIKAAEIRAATVESTSEDRLEAARARAASKPEGGGAEGSIALERAEKSAKEALARALGVEAKEANRAYITLKRMADGGDAVAKAKLAEVTPMKKRLEDASAEWENRKKAKTAPAAGAPAAAASGAAPPLPPKFKLD
jgi:hypothetical protein